MREPHCSVAVNATEVSLSLLDELWPRILDTIDSDWVVPPPIMIGTRS